MIGTLVCVDCWTRYDGEGGAGASAGVGAGAISCGACFVELVVRLGELLTDNDLLAPGGLDETAPAFRAIA